MRTSVLVGAFIGFLVGQMGNPLYYFGVDPNRPNNGGAGAGATKTSPVDNLIAVAIWTLLGMALGLVPMGGTDAGLAILTGFVVAQATDKSAGSAMQ